MAKAFGMNEELQSRLFRARSAEQVAELLTAAGQEISAEDVDHIWQEIEHHKTNVELSLDELDAVSGGADRDWAVDDCAATVEQGSWCDSNDKCILIDVTYEHLPCGDCPYCDGKVYGYSVWEGVFKCKKCGKISGRNAWMVDLP